MKPVHRLRQVLVACGDGTTVSHTDCDRLTYLGEEGETANGLQIDEPVYAVHKCRVGGGWTPNWWRRSLQKATARRTVTSRTPPRRQVAVTVMNSFHIGSLRENLRQGEVRLLDLPSYGMLAAGEGGCCQVQGPSLCGRG